ncbi:hypothetical protein M9H77_21390 [Catharanthus roseus]|uniref:Uncharacterized protein n=1 Tax=Catharanthus roseus TaxID=4058 RepID=A0ACC0AM60_CATRO|nr:hypothetical protein M9H77_21390 [Catharanthus roseus]
MSRCFCSYTQPSTSVAKFISSQPCLEMLENQCSTIKDLKIIHAQLIKTGLVKDKIAASRVLAVCANSPASDMNYAYLVFNHIENPNLFAWNTIIRGFSRSSTPEIAISLFAHMLVSSSWSPGRLTYPSVFKAYTQLGLAENGAQLHGRVMKQGLEFDPFIRNTILHMYASCGYLSEARKLFEEDEVLDVVAWNSMISGLAKHGEIDDSRRLFDKMTCRNDVTWNAMISGYVRNGNPEVAFDLFDEMQEQRMKPSEYTVVSLLNASADLGALEQGEWIHDYIKKTNIDLNVIVITAIINMYCKCGDIDMACQVFENATNKGLSCWNSLISGLANNGFCKEAIKLFSRLENSNLEPDSVSFLGVLTACNHSGLVNEARNYFKLMKEMYEIEPSVEHYGCLIDALGRAGFLEQAEELTKYMPMEPDVAIWGSLLSASRQHGNIRMAKLAAKCLNQLDPNENSSYLLLSNVYAASGHFEKAIHERVSMKDKQIEKQPGCSSIEVDGEVHEFLASGILQYQLPEYVLS